MSTVETISMNSEQAARALGVTDRTLRNWRRSGILKPTKVGRKTLYNVEDLRNLVKPQHALE
jgi:excisionase family DNA binding protein